MKDFSSAAPKDSDPIEVREVKFTLDKEEFTAQLSSDAASILGWSELASLATRAKGDMESAEGQAFTSRYFQMVLEDDEYLRFLAHLKKHHSHPDVLTGIMEYIQEVADEVVEGEAERPTMPSSTSSGGRTVKEDRMSLLSSLSEQGDVVIAQRPNREARRKADRAQARAAG